MKKQGNCSNNISRREFIKVTGVISVAMLCAPTMAGCVSMKEQAQFENDTVPVLKKCDVVIVGGGFAGVSAALNFSKFGKKVVLVERRIYLGREVTSEYRPWFDNSRSNMDLPEFMQACIEPEIDQPDNTKKLLRFDHVKRTLEDELFEHGVEIVYASNVTQVIADDDKLHGIVIGNKSGRQAILSKLVMDCSETASVVHLTRQNFSKKVGTSKFIRTLEYTNIELLLSKTIEVPSGLKMKDNKVWIQQGYLGKGHYFIDCPMVFNDPEFDARSLTNREVEAWERSNEVAKYLYQHVPEFKSAYLANSSYQLNGLYTSQMLDANYENDRQYLKQTISIQNEDIEFKSFATPYANLFCISEAALLNKKQTNFIKTPVGASEIASSLSMEIIKNWSMLSSEKEVKILNEDDMKASSAAIKTKEKYSPQKGKPYGRIRINNENIPVLDEVDVLVAGGGTSGAPATYTAAREGKKTLVVDMNPGFGGTGTYGGVQSYWGPGDYTGFTASHIKKTTEINSAFSKLFPDNGYGRWSVEAKMAMWLREIRNSGAQILWNSFVVGTIMKGNKVIGVVVSTPQGVMAVKSKIVIDATGDGDVAAFAGAPFVLGSEHNNVPLWYAIRRQVKPGPTESIFQSTVDVTNIEDYTRSVHVGLRTGGNKLHDHQPYLAPRESRHILGDVVTTLTDNLTFKEWKDVINIHRSNTDMKGYHSSDWFRIGLIPPNLSIEIPYRAIIPKDVENIIITGKAISTTHDSFPAIRMQHDLENLGGIAALAAVEAIDTNVLARDIDILKFQKKLVNMKLLPKDILGREIKPRSYTEEELREWIKQFEPDTSLKSFGNTKMSEIRFSRIPFVEVCTSPPQKAIPVLEEELKRNSGKMQLRIALALAMLGSESGAEIIYNEINNQLQSSLPVLKEHIEHSGNRPPPDQGAAPICANLVYALGMTRSDLNVFSVELVSELFRADSIDDFKIKNKALFFYIDAVCYAANMIGSKSVIPYMKKIHANQFLNNRSIKIGIEKDHILERLSLMELILGRALARSGSDKGYEILIEYLDDMRAILAEFSHGTLVKITKRDFGKKKEQWNKWLTTNKGGLKPAALEERPFG
ncbi:MAG: FAD-dependent oxidoreductase [Bacteroidetes bacterium]|nr:FAD-dependent oxidoreductase [Bacteroidota bacterium]